MSTRSADRAPSPKSLAAAESWLDRYVCGFGREQLNISSDRNRTWA